MTSPCPKGKNCENSTAPEPKTLKSEGALERLLPLHKSQTDKRNGLKRGRSHERNRPTVLAERTDVDP